MSSSCRRIDKYSRTKAKVRERKDTVDSNCSSSRARPVGSRSQVANSSKSNSTMIPPFRSGVTARI